MTEKKAKKRPRRRARQNTAASHFPIATREAAPAGPGPSRAMSQMLVSGLAGLVARAAGMDPTPFVLAGLAQQMPGLAERTTLGRDLAANAGRENRYREWLEMLSDRLMRIAMATKNGEHGSTERLALEAHGWTRDWLEALDNEDRAKLDARAVEARAVSDAAREAVPYRLDRSLRGGWFAPVGEGFVPVAHFFYEGAAGGLCGVIPAGRWDSLELAGDAARDSGVSFCTACEEREDRR